MKREIIVIAIMTVLFGGTVLVVGFRSQQVASRDQDIEVLKARLDTCQFMNREAVKGEGELLGQCCSPAVTP